jgi:hypothetical protein
LGLYAQLSKSAVAGAIGLRLGVRSLVNGGNVPRAGFRKSDGRSDRSHDVAALEAGQE